MTGRRRWSDDHGISGDWANERQDWTGTLRFKDGSTAVAVGLIVCKPCGRIIGWVYDNADETKGPLGPIAVLLDEPNPWTKMVAAEAIDTGQRRVLADDRARAPIALDSDDAPRTATAYCAKCLTTRTAVIDDVRRGIRSAALGKTAKIRVL